MKGFKAIAITLATVLVLGLCLAPGLEASKVDLLQLPRRAGQASVRTDSVGGGGDPTPFTIIAGLQMQFSEIFNTADFKLLVKMYCEHALLIPSTPNKFVTYDDLEAFWMDKFNQSGQEQIHTQPSIVFQESSTVIYEIGTCDKWGKPYFIRWNFCHNMQKWVIGTHIIAVGATPETDMQELIQKYQTKASDGSLMDIFKQLDKGFADDYNKRNFTGLLNYYTTSATLIPMNIGDDDSAGVIQRGDIPRYFQMGEEVMGIQAISLVPTMARLDAGSDTVAHEIGVSTLVQQGKTQFGYYYTRWVKENDQWLNDLDVLEIGL